MTVIMRVRAGKAPSRGNAIRLRTRLTYGYSRIAFAAALAGVALLTCTGSGQAQDFPGDQHYASGRNPADESIPLARRGWEYSVTGRTDLTFTDNAYLTTNGRQSDFIVTPVAAIGVHGTGSRTTIDANAEVAYDFYAHANDLNGIRVNILTDGVIRLDDAFSLRARAATNLQPSSQLDVIPATDRTVGGNQVQVLAYGITPAFHGSVSDQITADASYDLSGVSYLRAPNGAANVAASDSILQRGRVKLSNAKASAPFEWGLTGSIEHRSRLDSAPSSRRGLGEANGKYHFSPTFAVIARGGYDWIDEPTINERTGGIYGLGGILIQPSARTSLRLEAGYRYRKPTVSADLRYSHSRRVNIVASFEQGVDTSQGFLDDIYTNAGRDSLGNLVDPRTGLAPDPRLSPFDPSNQAFRYARFRLRMDGILGRNFYNASGNYERRSLNGLHGDSWGAQAVLGRELTRLLSATIEGRYVKTNSPTLAVTSALNAETISGTARLTYQISRTLGGSVRYTHLKHSTSLVNYRENVAMLSLVKRF